MTESIDGRGIGLCLNAGHGTQYFVVFLIFTERHRLAVR